MLVSAVRAREGSARRRQSDGDGDVMFTRTGRIATGAALAALALTACTAGSSTNPGATGGATGGSGGVRRVRHHRTGRRAGQSRLHQGRWSGDPAGAADERLRDAGQAGPGRQDRPQPRHRVEGLRRQEDLHVRPDAERQVQQRGPVHRRRRRLLDQPGQDRLDHLAQGGHERRRRRQGRDPEPASGDAEQAQQRLAVPDDHADRRDDGPEGRRRARHQAGGHRALPVRHVEPRRLDHPQGEPGLLGQAARILDRRPQVLQGPAPR